jgi:alpha-tubulin suppressor-like RCC1 family protein
MVSSSGTVKGLAKGVAIISASADFASGWASITVSTGDAPPPGFALASVNVGDTHSCGVDANGVAYCWGWNFFGQLGNNTRGDELDRFPTPAAVVTDMRFASLRLGQYHSCSLQADGKAACWGSNSSGELGTHATIGEVGGTTVPYPVLGDLAFTQLSAGGSHTCGVTADGQAHCWGANDVGQLGKGDLANAPTPALVSQSVQFKAIAAGLYSTCALAETGEAYCWGDGTRGQLGTTATFDSSTKERAPKAVAGAKQFEQLHLNSSHACAVTKGGETYCWGNNTYGQLGSGSAVIAVGTPQKVTTDQAFVMVTTGAHHSCGLTNAGRVYCWGNNDNAQLGDGTLTSRAAPVPVLTDLSFEAIESGANATCGRTTQGEAWCWGSGYFGETGSGLGGDGSFSVVPSPVTVPVP